MTHFKNDRGETMNTPSTLRRTLPSMAIALILGLALIGCDSSNARLRGLNSGEQTNANNDNANNGTPGGDEDVEVEPMDEEGHGTSADEQEKIEPGFMNGSWRAATGEQDTPAVYFDTFQDKGDAAVTGTYLMALGIYERLDGESGDIQHASFDGNTLTIEWNPTNDREEVLTLEASKVDENTLEGTVTAKRNVNMNIPVTITRTTE